MTDFPFSEPLSMRPLAKVGASIIVRSDLPRSASCLRAAKRALSTIRPMTSLIASMSMCPTSLRLTGN